MKLRKRIAEIQRQGLRAAGHPLLAFLGDSVTHGCFEVYPHGNGELTTVNDWVNVYHAQLIRRMSELFPHVPFDCINAGISGDNAAGGLARLERDVLSKRPDLLVVCFGLNDAHGGMEKLAEYKRNMVEILRRAKEIVPDVILLTPNMMATNVDPMTPSGMLTDMAKATVVLQNGGTVDAYMDAARAAAAETGAVLCDCYKQWKQLEALGADITELLCNYINHPSRAMHTLFADALLNLILYSEETE